MQFYAWYCDTKLTFKKLLKFNFLLDTTDLVLALKNDKSSNSALSAWVRKVMRKEEQKSW